MKYNVILFALALQAIAIPIEIQAQDNPCGVEGVVIEASNFQYAPDLVLIEPGQTVVWVNMGGFHDVNGLSSTLGDVWDNPDPFYIDAVSGNAEGTCLGTYTFTVEGVYTYDCSIGSHAQNGMVATIQVESGKPLSVSEVSLPSTLRVFPNPSEGGVVTVTGDWKSGAVVLCYDAQGRLMHQTVAAENQHVLDVTGWEGGSYTVVVASGDQKVTRQFIVR